ncbi:MAG: TetR/AcrR family transcriptional regulator [Gammaproteobacteria bacterium]|nr:TetR/AcrR family transcriptional regulator [Gammaproteobacteria bacterium]MDH3446717.1 TetR/AcrR family transcriptional regulator [Gammaproteobacteria bacterium]
MAQQSKKDHIAASALPLFLEHGFKGTSIDMVVRASGVSKPTVYNHFPDKSALILAVLTRWIEHHKPLIQQPGSMAELESFMRSHWLTDEAVRIYAIVIGEGWRFPEARQLFWEQFDRLWRVAFCYLSDRSPNLERSDIDRQLDRHLIERLRTQ